MSRAHKDAFARCAARRSPRAISSLIVALAMSGVVVAALAAEPVGAAGTTRSVVTAADIYPHGAWALEPTSNTGTYSFVGGPASPPGGVGSLAMSIASGQHEWLNNYSYGACASGPSCSEPVAN